MSAVTRPKGPLPARVYWFRRVLVLGVAALLVFGLVRVLGALGDSSDQGDDAGAAAQLVAGSPTAERSGAPDPTPDQAPDRTQPDAALTEAPEKATEKASEKAQKKAEKKQQQEVTPPPLPAPTGECRNDDIVIKPVVTRSHAGSRVEFNLEISTRETAACTWSASRSTLVVNITSGKDDIWTTRHCPGGLSRPVAVIARQQTPAIVGMHWSGRRSDAECSNLTAWALPGFYHVQAAALGGEPSSVQFELGKAQPATVTKTIQPDPKQNKTKNKNKDKKKKKKNRNRNRPGTQPTEEPLGDGSDGAVEPDGP